MFFTPATVRVVLLFFCFAILSLVSYTIAEESNSQTPATASRPSTLQNSTLPAEEVAKEIVKIQERLGGSIVHDHVPNQPAPHGWNARNVPVATDRPDLRSYNSPWPQRAHASRSKVSVLRDTAWQLDSSAHKLEQLELYEQADALREVATQMRLDARKLKQSEIGH